MEWMDESLLPELLLPGPLAESLLEAESLDDLRLCDELCDELDWNDESLLLELPLAEPLVESLLDAESLEDLRLCDELSDELSDELCDELDDELSDELTDELSDEECEELDSLTLPLLLELPHHEFCVDVIFRLRGKPIAGTVRWRRTADACGSGIACPGSRGESR